MNENLSNQVIKNTEKLNNNTNMVVTFEDGTTKTYKVLNV